MKTLASFKDIHKGETIIVCGCGTSLNLLTQPQRFITIGVNDVGRKFHPNYLVVVNPPNQFVRDRFQYVRDSCSPYLFTQLDLGKVNPEVVPFRLGTRGGTHFNNPDVLHYTQNSPYVALCLAVHMGATRIGLIGVDFTDHHFFDRTGRHVLTPQLARIDKEYKNLAQALSQIGIEVVNLSPESRLTAFRKGELDKTFTVDTPPLTKSFSECGTPFTKAVLQPEVQPHAPGIYFINYKFLSCGDVFRTGLNHAAQSIGIPYRESYWDDPNLPKKIHEFNPDLIFVVHGRKFAQRWKDTFKSYNTALWLLDEPYEVDDTSRFSHLFNTQFVNDPSTLQSHPNAHYLPVCFDPLVYYDNPRERKYLTGFIGGSNPVRQKFLETLYENQLLSYVVGGPWKGHKLNFISLSNNIPHEQTAELYRQTKIIINIFRSQHHYNTRKIPAQSLNPRIYEALACGALVISEERPEIQTLFPMLPVFRSPQELTHIITQFLHDDEKRVQVLHACREALSCHSFAHRLQQVISIAIQEKKTQQSQTITQPNTIPAQESLPPVSLESNHSNLPHHFIPYGQVIYPRENGEILLKKNYDAHPGSEHGLAHRHSFSSIDLSFQVNISHNACFIAKVFQQHPLNQLSDSYHLYCNNKDYFARHNHIFKYIKLPRNQWEKIRITATKGNISFFINDALQFQVSDSKLKEGYPFLGVKGGEVMLRDIRIASFDSSFLPSATSLNDLQANDAPKNSEEYQVIVPPSTQTPPLVSIVTTVYDRVHCLRNCIASVKQLTFTNYQHIIVADCPPLHIIQQLKQIVSQAQDGKISLVNLTRRYNNWGIKPASVGVSLSNGKYLCFLSDDNGYDPQHFQPLVEALEKDPQLGFAYSSCLYDGRIVLRSSVPRPARIDLGQPLFRRELFNIHFARELPFTVFAWDWYLIHHFMQHHVQWKHIDRPSFIFRLDKYPLYIRKLQKMQS